jgi:hypothetical protein
VYYSNIDYDDYLLKDMYCTDLMEQMEKIEKHEESRNEGMREP